MMTLTEQQKQELINIIETVAAAPVDSMPWPMILTVYEQALRRMGQSPALAAVYELGTRQGAGK